MRNRIISYSRKISQLIAEQPSDTNWNSVLNDLLIQIHFFQHERLIHLIVTVTFALLEMLSIFLSVFCELPAAIILSIIILCLLVPYIRHYYLLENEVQKMYTYYDKITVILVSSEQRNKNTTQTSTSQDIPLTK